MSHPTRAPGSRDGRTAILAAVAAALLLLAGMALPSVAADDDEPPTPPPTPTVDAERDTLTHLTLVTGHEVAIEVHPDGRRSVTLLDDEVEFETWDTGDGFYVVPADAAELVPEAVDPELFNIDKLLAVQDHVGEGEVPVIVAYDASARPRSGSIGTLSAERHLEAIDAVAANLDAATAAAFWSEISGDGEVARSTAPGIERVWLDEAVTAALDDSVPQVGAPAVWDIGFDGDGVTVAVLDTGIDDAHPDLVGQVAAASNFTDDEADGDEHGHGTHVAATVAGTGNGSDGARPGVAPGATLVDGKVLAASGSGLTSWVIAGMEWAALDQEVDVVNMSLGAGPTDGTDPVSMALNQLSEDTGTVFVVAAGNLGSRSYTIGAPAAADHAIAVGSTWKSDFLHASSSRGPRPGDHAIKPALTAPGVNIAAARAEGTSMGTPIDELYTRATGTSMAAPHVAGGVALLLQQRGDWGLEEVRSALATTAEPHGSFTVYDQGGGRMDVEAAVTTPVLATPAPLDLGYFPYPQEDVDPVSEAVTYTNLTDDPIELDLHLEVADEDGAEPADGMLSLSPDTVALAPGEATEVTVTLDVMAGEHGLYGGSLFATDDGETVVRTPLGFHNEDERYELSIEGIDADGGPATGSSGVAVMNVEDRDSFFESGIGFIEGVATARVPPGTYSVTGFIYTYEGDEAAEVSAMAAPEFSIVDDDHEMVLDARDAGRISVDTPAHDSAPRQRTTLGLYRQPAEGPGFSTSSSYFVEGRTFSAGPTAEVDVGVFEFFSRWQLADPAEPIDTPFLYDVVLPESAVPEELSYTLTPEQLATNQQRFHTHDPDHAAQEFRTAWRPWMSTTVSVGEPVPTAGERLDLLATADTSWTRTLLFAPPGVPSLAARMNAPRMEYQPGTEQARSWMEQPAAPSLIEGSPWHPSFPQYREGDELELFIAEYGDAQRGHWSWSHGSIDEIAFRVFRDGELIADAPRARGTFEMPPEPATVRLELDTAREGLDWWHYSTRTHTAWTFETNRPADGATVMLPLLFVDFDLGVDLENRAPHPRDRRGPRTVEFEVRHQPDLEDPPAIAAADLHVSTDDGDTWEAVPRVQEIAPGRFRATLSSQDLEGASVSLRVSARDVDDNTIEQRIIRAYGEPER